MPTFPGVFNFHIQSTRQQATTILPTGIPGRDLWVGGGMWNSFFPTPARPACCCSDTKDDRRASEKCQGFVLGSSSLPLTLRLRGELCPRLPSWIVIYLSARSLELDRGCLESSRALRSQGRRQ